MLRQVCSWGIVILLAAPTSVMCGSALARWLRQKYGLAAVLRVGMLAAIESVLPAVLDPFAGNSMSVLILIGIMQLCISLLFGVAPAALYEVTPNQYRGQIIAV